jgi:hypothetical protein
MQRYTKIHETTPKIAESLKIKWYMNVLLGIT